MLFDTVPAHSFPHSKKCELEKIDKLYNPGPGKYDPKLYTFTKLPTWKIGTTKRKVFTVLEEYPGPGTYSIPVEITNGPKYSMSTKAGLKESKEKFLNPGPAHYKPLFSKSQKYFYTFGLKTIIKDRDKTPGPGNYDLRKEKDLIIPSYLFGKEKREDEIVKRRKKIPGPGKYEFCADPIRIHKPIYSFGKQTKGRNYSNYTPGPGSYSFKEFIGKEAPKKTIGIKYNYSSNDLDIITPGPGHYDQSNPNKYLHKNPNTKISKAKRITDINDLRNENPGPGQYNDDITLKNILIKNPSWKIGTSKRKSLDPSDKSFPGVGNYSISGIIGSFSPHYTMRIKGIMSNFNTDSPGPGTYKNEKMGLYKHYPSWKIGTGKRDEDLRRTIKEGFPGPGKYGFKALQDFFSPKYKFGNRKRFSGNNFETPGPGSYHIPCSIVDITNYTREQGKFDEKFKFI
jgi:hypothetical protein